MPSMPDGIPAGDARGWTERVEDLAQLDRVARRLAAILPPRALVALEGDLGAGKTTLVKAVAVAAGLDPAEIVSPTFGLLHVHGLPRRDGGPERIVHADFYRLAGAVDLHEIGWEEATAGRAWVFVEWPSRAAEALWSDRLDVVITVTGETSRTLEFTPRGRFSAVVPPA
jgi:tRNA threonylcarbamoyl adenosine modification protein YjeE